VTVDPRVAEGTFVDVRGTRTHLHDAGSGPPVVRIHGSGPGVSAWANWRLTLPHLAANGFRALAYDIAGFGATERQAGVHYGIEHWVAHLVALLEDVVGEPAMLLGNSLGGGIALRIATEHPKLVRRMALMGSIGVPHPITASLDAVWGYTPSLEHMRALITERFAFDPRLATDDLVRMRHEASIQPGVQEAYAALFPAPRQRWVDALVVSEDRIARVAVPTLLIHGREDRVIPLACSYRLLELIPDAQLHVFGRCGHWTQVERAADFNALCTHFFGMGRTGTAVYPGE
jgi:2-hydroxymuconate-semialdehyde hydrolase